MKRTKHLLVRLGQLMLVVLFCGCAGLAPVDDPEPTQPEQNRDAITLRMVQLAQAGRMVEARDSIRSYLADHPHDGTMLYNLACLDLLLNDQPQAMSDLESALASGYTNFRLIENDRSLKPLRSDPRFADMVLGYEMAFRDTFQARALILDEGYAFEGIPLRPGDGLPGSSLKAWVSLDFDHNGLHVVVETNDQAHRFDRLPWDGGNGILVNLIRPISLDDYESPRYHSLGVGVVNGTPQTYLVGHDGDVLLQHLPSIKPTVSKQDGGLRFEVTIPWANFHPYGPPLDQDMGLNVMYLGAGDASTRTVFSLMPEGRLSFEADPWRRFVPVSFYTSDLTQPAVKGRLYDRLVESGVVELEYVLWSLTAGQGTCRLSVVGQDGSSLESGLEISKDIKCEEGLNFFNESMDLTGLPTGSYRLKLSVEGPDGIPLALEESFSLFDTNWLKDLNQRIYVMTNPESSILRYRLFAMARDLDRRHPQDSAFQLHADYQQLVAMTKVCELGGSCLPDNGVFVGGFAVDTMVQRMCVMHLPEGHQLLESPRLLVVLPPRPGAEEQLASELGAALSEESDLIILVPQSHGASGLAIEKATHHTELVMAWARGLFHTDHVTLVGLGGGADAAMAVSLKNPDTFDSVLLCADHLFLEDDRFSGEHLRSTLAGHKTSTPYTLVSRLIADNRMSIIESTMRGLGYRLEVMSVPEKQADAIWIGDWVKLGTLAQ